MVDGLESVTRLPGLARFAGTRSSRRAPVPTPERSPCRDISVCHSDAYARRRRGERGGARDAAVHGAELTFVDDDPAQITLQATGGKAGASSTIPPSAGFLA